MWDIIYKIYVDVLDMGSCLTVYNPRDQELFDAIVDAYQLCEWLMMSLFDLLSLDSFKSFKMMTYVLWC